MALAIGIEVEGVPDGDAHLLWDIPVFTTLLASIQRQIPLALHGIPKRHAQAILDYAVVGSDLDTAGGALARRVKGAGKTDQEKGREGAGGSDASPSPWAQARAGKPGGFKGKFHEKSGNPACY